MANPLTARMHKGINTTCDEGQTLIGGFFDVAHSLRAEGFDASEDGTGLGTPLVFDTTQITSAANYSNPKAHPPAVATAMQVRRLTPVECARLQGFSDTYLDITYRGKPAADGPRYKALGNSFAVPVVRWIGQRIEQVGAIDG